MICLRSIPNSKGWQEWRRRASDVHVSQCLGQKAANPNKGAVLGGSDGKVSVYNVGGLGSIPGLGSSLEKEMATHSRVLPRKSHGQRSLVSMGSQRVGHDWVTFLSLSFHLILRYEVFTLKQSLKTPMWSFIRVVEITVSMHMDTKFLIMGDESKICRKIITF